MAILDQARHHLEPATAPVAEDDPVRATTFANDTGYCDLVLVRDILFRWTCRHHLLPWAGAAHVGYLPPCRLMGLSKLARAVDYAAEEPGAPDEIANRVAEHAGGHGTAVVIEAEHACSIGSTTDTAGSCLVTSAQRGSCAQTVRGSMHSSH